MAKFKTKVWTGTADRSDVGGPVKSQGVLLVVHTQDAMQISVLGDGESRELLDALVQVLKDQCAADPRPQARVDRRQGGEAARPGPR